MIEAILANLREYWIGMKARRRAHGEGWLTALRRLVGADGADDRDD